MGVCLIECLSSTGWAMLTDCEQTGIMGYTKLGDPFVSGDT